MTTAEKEEFEELAKRNAILMDIIEDKNVELAEKDKEIVGLRKLIGIAADKLSLDTAHSILQERNKIQRMVDAQKQRQKAGKF